MAELAEAHPRLRRCRSAIWVGPSGSRGARHARAAARRRGRDRHGARHPHRQLRRAPARRRLRRSTSATAASCCRPARIGADEARARGVLQAAASTTAACPTLRRHRSSSLDGVGVPRDAPSNTAEVVDRRATSCAARPSPRPASPSCRSAAPAHAHRGQPRGGLPAAGDRPVACWCSSSSPPASAWPGVVGAGCVVLGLLRRSACCPTAAGRVAAACSPSILALRHRRADRRAPLLDGHRARRCSSSRRGSCSRDGLMAVVDHAARRDRRRAPGLHRRHAVDGADPLRHARRSGGSG